MSTSRKPSPPRSTADAELTLPCAFRSSPGKSKNGRSPRKSLPAVDIATLMLPNKPVSKSSSGRVSSPVRSSQSKVIDLAE